LGVFFPIDNALYSIGLEVGVGLHTAGEVCLAFVQFLNQRCR